MLHGGAVPLKTGLSQEESLFWRLWMTFWLQGNALPVVWIFYDLFRKSWWLKTHVLSPSLPWAVDWESQEDFRVVSAGRCKMFPGAIGCFPGHEIWEWSVHCHLHPWISATLTPGVHLKIFVDPTSCKALLIERNPKSPQKPLKWAVILGVFLINEFW